MTEEQNKLAEEIERHLAPDAIYSRWRPSMDDMRLIVEALREPATDAVRDDECWEIIKALDAEGKASSLIGYPLTDTNRPTIRAWLQKRIEERALKGKGASQGAEGVGLTVHEADIIAAAVQLVPLLEEGWDEYDAPEDQSEGARACDALIKAVNAMLQAPDEQKG